MNINYKLAGIIVPAAVLMALATPVFATTTVNTGVSAGTTARDTKKVDVKASARLGSAETKAVARADAEIAKRLGDLATLSARINAMSNLSAASKASLTASIQTIVTDLTALKAKIAADATAAELKADMESITKSYRVYMLVVPQARILAAVDRANTVADMFAALNAKLQVRISAAAAAGKDMTAISNAQLDMNAKLADLRLQTAAAVGYVANLAPDNGDKTVAAANAVALGKARADLRVAESDLRAAHKDVKIIIAELKGFGDVSANASATTR